MISIVVPYRNAAPWIRRCCESLHWIADDGFEFLMVDDNTFLRNEDEKIVAEYAVIDDRFRMLVNEREPGVSGARNTGIYRSEGKYVTFLDADDELTERADWAYHTTIQVGANIHQMNHFRSYAIGSRTERYINNEGWYDVEHLPEAWFGVWNKIFLREFLVDNDIWFQEGLQYGEDGLFVFDCLAHDNRIHHASKIVKAVTKHFDNKNSLSHVKTGADLIYQVDAYKDWMLRQTDPKMRFAMCKELSRLWGSRRFERAFGE